VAIAYLMQKTPHVFPIIGGRKVEHLLANLEALEISLTRAQIAHLDGVVPFNKGFPYGFFVSDFSSSLIQRAASSLTTLRMFFQGDGEEYNFLFTSAGHFDRWPRAEAIRPALSQ
jgi:hypothetical protein